ncbi:MAG TPA: M48 family metalloprotease [Thermoanaerobaculia bacterium]|jgi:predicted Zn-dependent protease|nr:M48 family metalloprotease [Thermoanaerobaculia bacterium]
MRNTSRLVAAVLVTLLVLPLRDVAAQTISDPGLFEKSLQAAQEVVTQYGIYDNPAELARINRIAYELAQQSDYQQFPYTFTLIEMPVPNAFTLPGGQIFVTRGLLDIGLDDDMLASVLGHEIGHMVHEHYKKMQRRAILMNVLGNLLTVGVMLDQKNRQPTNPNIPYDPRVGVDYGTDRVQGAAAASLVLSELLLRSYSRENEDEADAEGQRLSALAGYNPNGAQRMWEAMNKKTPQLREYGYMQTHPFGEERQRYASARKETWKIQPRQSADAYRMRTQALLASWKAKEKPHKPEQHAQQRPGEHVQDLLKKGPQAMPFLDLACLATWPQGKIADGIRLASLHRQRDAELAKPSLSRDYGAVIRKYRDELSAVRVLDPKSELAPALQAEIADLDAKRKELYPKAVQVLGGGIYETSFLVSFMSNFPDVKEAPEVGLALGDAYSRLGNQTEGVSRYLAAWQSAPDSPQGKRAQMGLRNLAPNLKELSALQQLALQDRDADIRKVASDRLAREVKTYDDLANGAEYLRRYPDGQYAKDVLERLNVLADNLYGEVILYQGMGDPVRAVERINKILTNAPLSPAASKLRDRAVLTEAKEG